MLWDDLKVEDWKRDETKKSLWLLGGRGMSEMKGKGEMVWISKFLERRKKCMKIYRNGTSWTRGRRR